MKQSLPAIPVSEMLANYSKNFLHIIYDFFPLFFSIYPSFYTQWTLIAGYRECFQPTLCSKNVRNEVFLDSIHFQ